MLVFDFSTIGNKLYSIRKRTGLTQAEVAEAAELSTRTYADIERGSVNMRIETVLRICSALHITPDEIFTKDNSSVSSAPINAFLFFIIFFVAIESKISCIHKLISGIHRRDVIIDIDVPNRIFPVAK